MKSVFRPAVLLSIVALLCSSGVVLMNQLTYQRIEAMRQEKIRQQLHEVLPAHYYNNQLADDTIELSHPLLGSALPQTIWRARKDGKPVAAILSATAPDGYGGPITLLICVALNGELTGVRVITHRETPGLGDDIDIARSEWIRGFEGYSLVNLTPEEWRVRKDGGHFEHFTGATITPRSVTAAVQSALVFFRENRQVIFAGPASKLHEQSRLTKPELNAV